MKSRAEYFSVAGSDSERSPRRSSYALTFAAGKDNRVEPFTLLIHTTQCWVPVSLIIATSRILSIQVLRPVASKFCTTINRLTFHRAQFEIGVVERTRICKRCLDGACFAPTSFNHNTSRVHSVQGSHFGKHRTRLNTSTLRYTLPTHRPVCRRRGMAGISPRRSITR